LIFSWSVAVAVAELTAVLAAAVVQSFREVLL
jgi:hypothetical protein